MQNVDGSQQQNAHIRCQLPVNPSDNDDVRAENVDQVEEEEWHQLTAGIDVFEKLIKKNYLWQ